eukprot:1146356-Pelagomonas_calceolata.AAC.1
MHRVASLNPAVREGRTNLVWDCRPSQALTGHLAARTCSLNAYSQTETALIPGTPQRSDKFLLFNAQTQELDRQVQRSANQILRGSGSSALTAVMWRVSHICND